MLLQCSCIQINEPSVPQTKGLLLFELKAHCHKQEHTTQPHVGQQSHLSKVIFLVEDTTTQKHYLHKKKHRTSKKTVNRTISQLRCNECRQYELMQKVCIDSSAAEPLEQIVTKRVSSSGLEQRDHLQTGFQGAEAELLLEAGAKAASPLDVMAARPTTPSLTFDSCTEDEHTERAASSEVTALQEPNKTDALPRKRSEVWLRSLFHKQEPYMFFKSSCKTGWDAVSNINIWKLQKVLVGGAKREGKWSHAVCWSARDIPIHKDSVLSSCKKTKSN